MYSQFVIGPANKRGDLLNVIKIISEINESLKSDKVNMIDKTIKNINKYFTRF